MSGLPSDLLQALNGNRVGQPGEMPVHTLTRICRWASALGVLAGQRGVASDLEVKQEVLKPRLFPRMRSRNEAKRAERLANDTERTTLLSGYRLFPFAPDPNGIEPTVDPRLAPASNLGLMMTRTGKLVVIKGALHSPIGEAGNTIVVANGRTDFGDGMGKNDMHQLDPAQPIPAIVEQIGLQAIQNGLILFAHEHPNVR